MLPNVPAAAEWIEPDGLGGFASGTVSGIRTRRYHALLLVATKPPVGRFVLVNGFEARVVTPQGTFALTSQRYRPDVVHPDGAQRIESFTTDPWPTWTFRLEGGAEVEQQIFVPKESAVCVMYWRLRTPRPGVTLHVRPLLSGRDYHCLHQENPVFRFDADAQGDRVTWRPYEGVPAISALSNGTYVHQPDWYRNFLYTEERARGLDCLEDLASPGVFRFDLSRGPATLLVAAGTAVPATIAGIEPLRTAEAQRRSQFPTRLHRAADAYVVRRGAGRTIIAGYPWFTDWGRDTFVALRGLCLATGRLDEAREVLQTWAGAVSEGMLPNRFPEQGEPSEFNSVDASLWFIVAVHDYLRAGGRDEPAMRAAVEQILAGYAQGTRFGIHADDDGLLAAGQPGVPLTWMDAKIGDHAVTPRPGKPVEVQALWLNALRIGSEFSPRWGEVFARGRESFRARFWNEPGGCLYDVIDPVDASFRPNQILAVGGLPYPLLDGERAQRVVAAVESRLVTPLGLRSLAPGEPGYCPRYEGGVRERDGAYHQGTVWPWLLGPFVEAWVRVRGDTAEAKRQARRQFLEPLLRQLDVAGLGHISEIADADPPHAPRGCPFQAWSVGEALRLSLVVLAEDEPKSAEIKTDGKERNHERR